MPTTTPVPTIKLDTIDMELIEVALISLSGVYMKTGDDYFIARASLADDLITRLDSLPRPKWLEYQLTPYRGQ